MKTVFLASVLCSFGYAVLEKKGERFFRVDQDGPGCRKERREINSHQIAEWIIAFNKHRDASNSRTKINEAFNEALEARYPFQAVLGVLLEEV